MNIKKLITSQDSGDNLTRYFAEVRNYKSLTKEQERELIILIHKNNDAKALDKLIKANLKFVISVAKHYQGQGTPILDLISEGNAGMVASVQHFDIDCGLKFFSYAVWWIRMRIFKSLDLHKRTIQLPANRELLVIRIKKEIPILENKLGRYPTSHELEEYLKKKFKKEGKDNPPSALDIEEAICYGKRTKSIHEKVGGEEEDDTLESFIPGDMNIDQNKMTDSMFMDMDRFFYNLTQLEYDVLILSMGLNGEPIKRTGDIAHALGLTDKEVVRLKAKSIRRLKALKNINILKDYLS